MQRQRERERDLERPSSLLSNCVTLHDNSPVRKIAWGSAHADSLAEQKKRLHLQGGNQAVDAQWRGQPLQRKPWRQPGTEHLPATETGSLLTEAWLLTVSSLLEEGDSLLQELAFTPQQVHGNDVVALSEGAEESTQGLTPDTKSSTLAS